MRGRTPALLAVLLVSLTSGSPDVASAQTPTTQTQRAPSAQRAPAAPGAATLLRDNDSILINGRTFTITPGTPRNGPVAPLDTSGARELGVGAIVFRSGDKLYIIDAPSGDPSPRRLAVSAPTGAAPAGVPETEPDNGRTNRIRIEYVPPKEPELQNVYDLLRQRRMLEIVQTLFSPFRFPIDVTVRAMGCDGLVNAWYERVEGRPTVTICYEYVRHIMRNAEMIDAPWGITMQDAICGQFIFVVAHEMGHAFFDIYAVPVFGREEDAADQVATFFILHLTRTEARRLIGGAAYAYMDYIKGYKDNPKVLVPLTSFSSSHGSPEERFYNLLCIAYGGDPALFGDFVEKGILPSSRARDCRYEFRTLKKAMYREIGPHLDFAATRTAWNLEETEQKAMMMMAAP